MSSSLLISNDSDERALPSCDTSVGPSQVIRVAAGSSMSVLSHSLIRMVKRAQPKYS